MGLGRRSRSRRNTRSREPRYPRSVVSRAGDGPGVEGRDDARAEGEDAQWVRSFLRTQPGKTYRLDAADEAHEEAAREALAVAARTLTDEVLRGSEVPGPPDDGRAPGPPA
jgi:hypothetical protein